MQIKWVTLASLSLFIVVTVGRGLFGKSTEQEQAEFEARFPTKDMCLSGVSERIAPCTTPGCYDLGWSFLDQCLKSAEGDKDEFCANVLGKDQDSQGHDLFATHCEPFTPYRSECDKVIARVGSYCSRII